ncbi:hypothetical protein ACIP46_16635 [Streptomyces lavendulae]|uniref:hypothetical protein n=1 Tax=Streptomyces lavendulae TaxID=1914 RepID=UPI0037F6EF79
MPTARFWSWCPVHGASATACHEVALGLSGRGPEPSDAPCTAAAADFEAHRIDLPAPGTSSAAVVRGGAIVPDIAHTGTLVVTAARIVLGAPVPADTTSPADRPGLFRYAGRPALSLYARRLPAHLTPRSVYFQNAVRMPLALAASRMIEGVLDLSTGVWTLLATLTVMRISAAGTRTQAARTSEAQADLPPLRQPRVHDPDPGLRRRPGTLHDRSRAERPRPHRSGLGALGP